MGQMKKIIYLLYFLLLLTPLFFLVYLGQERLILPNQNPGGHSFLQTSQRNFIGRRLWEKIRKLLKSQYQNDQWFFQAKLSYSTIKNRQINVKTLFAERDNNFGFLSRLSRDKLRALKEENFEKFRGWLLSRYNVLKRLKEFWAAIQPILRDWKNPVVNTITFKGKKYKIKWLFAQKNNTVLGFNLPRFANNQLQALVNAGISRSQMQTALNNVNNARLKTLWRQIQNKLQAYPGSALTTKITISSNGPFTINHLLTEKNSQFNALSGNAKTQLQALLNAKVTSGELGTALTTHNTNALNALWSTLQPHLRTYQNLPPNSIRLKGTNYNIDQLFAQKDHDRNRGSTISNTGNPSARDQLQALVNSGINSYHIQKAIINADKQLLDNNWVQLKQQLSAYSGFQFKSVEVSSRSYTLTDLWNKVSSTDAGSTFKGSALDQLRKLINDGIDSTQIKDPLEKLNNQKLKNFWITLKTALASYTGPNPDNKDITIDGKKYKLNLLFENKESAVAGDRLPAPIKVQLQALVNGGVTDATNVRTALGSLNNRQIKIPLQSFPSSTSTALDLSENNRRLDNKWNELKSEFSTYSGFKSDSVEIGSTSYTLTALWPKVLTNENGSAFVDDAKSQLQLLIDDSIIWNQIKTELDKLNNQKLDTLWTALKQIANLGGYTGFNPGNTDITIDDKQYKLNLLIENKESAVAGDRLDAPIKAQLQALVNGGITDANAVRTALDLENNRQLNSKWNELKTELSSYPGFKSDSVEIGSTSYTLTALWPKALTNENGSAFVDDAKSQLQLLIDDSITWNQIKTELDQLNNQKLDDLWSAIQPTLNSYQNLPPDSITHGSQSNLNIEQLFVQKTNTGTGSTLPTNAKAQLQTLINAGMMTGSSMQTALDSANTVLLTKLWEDIQDELKTYSKNSFNKPITVQNKGSFTLNHLLTEKGNDFATLSDNAKAQLQLLLNAKIKDYELKTTFVISQPSSNKNLAIGLGTAVAVIIFIRSFSYFLLQFKRNPFHLKKRIYSFFHRGGG